MNYAICMRCGKRVSNEVTEELTIRAWVECPECISPKHSPDCDTQDANPDGIRKPCNCGTEQTKSDLLQCAKYHFEWEKIEQVFRKMGDEPDDPSPQETQHREWAELLEKLAEEK